MPLSGGAGPARARGRSAGAGTGALPSEMPGAGPPLRRDVRPFRSRPRRVVARVRAYGDGDRRRGTARAECSGPAAAASRRSVWIGARPGPGGMESQPGVRRRAAPDRFETLGPTLGAVERPARPPGRRRGPFGRSALRRPPGHGPRPGRRAPVFPARRWTLEPSPARCRRAPPSPAARKPAAPRRTLPAWAGGAVPRDLPGMTDGNGTCVRRRPGQAAASAAVRRGAMGGWGGAGVAGRDRALGLGSPVGASGPATRPIRAAPGPPGTSRDGARRAVGEARAGAEREEPGDPDRGGERGRAPGRGVEGPQTRSRAGAGDGAPPWTRSTRTSPAASEPWSRSAGAGANGTALGAGWTAARAAASAAPPRLRRPRRGAGRACAPRDAARATGRARGRARRSRC